MFQSYLHIIKFDVSFVCSMSCHLKLRCNKRQWKSYALYNNYDAAVCFSLVQKCSGLFSTNFPWFCMECDSFEYGKLRRNSDCPEMMVPLDKIENLNSIHRFCAKITILRKARKPYETIFIMRVISANHFQYCRLDNAYWIMLLSIQTKNLVISSTYPTKFEFTSMRCYTIRVNKRDSALISHDRM